MPTIKPIRTDEDYEHVVSRVACLMKMDEEKMPQNLSDELKILITILDSYEPSHFPKFKPDPIKVIEYHVNDRDITLEALEPCIGSAKKFAPILAGKQPLTLYRLEDIWNLGLFEKREDCPICLVPQTGCQDDILPLYSNSIFRKQLWDRYYTPTQSLPMRLEKRSKKRPHRSQIAHYQGATD